MLLLVKTSLLLLLTIVVYLPPLLVVHLHRLPLLQKLWSDSELAARHGAEAAGTSNTFENLRRAMEREERPSLTQALERANPKLK